MTRDKLCLQIILADALRQWHSDRMKKRYQLYSEHLKQTFGGRVHKISIDAGYGCPNRQGGRVGAGCLFCDPGGSGSDGLERQLSITDQIETAKELMVRKYRAQRFIAYFQPFSNTYAPLDTLRRDYDEALAVADVVGLAVGTRPDCLGDDVLDLLAEYSRRTDLWLEIGLQSIHDQSLNFLRRGHDYATFLTACAGAMRRGIRVCVHLILGLPGEDREAMLATADAMAQLKIDGIKIHLLHVLRKTELGDLYQKGAIELLTQDDYVTLVADFIERLHPQTLIHRLTGDGPREILLAPLWSLNKWEVLNAIDAELERRKTTQGSRCSVG